MNIFPEFIPIVGPVLASAIAGCVAFLASVFTKELKTSEFRQAWIDALREDISELVATSILIQEVVAVKFQEGKSAGQVLEYMLDHQEKFLSMELCVARTKLRLNSEEHGKLISLIGKIADPVPNIRSGDVKELKVRVDELFVEAQISLKNEWRRVKRGEPVFVVTKCASLVVLLVALVFLFLLLSNHIYFA